MPIIGVHSRLPLIHRIMAPYMLVLRMFDIARRYSLIQLFQRTCRTGKDICRYLAQTLASPAHSTDAQSYKPPPPCPSHSRKTHIKSLNWVVMFAIHSGVHFDKVPDLELKACRLVGGRFTEDTIHNHSGVYIQHSLYSERETYAPFILAFNSFTSRL